MSGDARLEGVLRRGGGSKSAMPEHVRPNDAATRIRVLLVDDDANVLESTRLVLEMSDFDVRTAMTGHDALEAGDVFRPEVVLLDIGLPDMDGWATGRQVRESDWGRDAVLVALTGWGRREDVRRSREAGFDHHLIKPMDPDSLLALIGSARTTTARAADAA